MKKIIEYIDFNYNRWMAIIYCILEAKALSKSLRYRNKANEHINKQRDKLESK